MAEPSKEDLERARRLLLAQTWIFAKTMPHCPHYYTLRKRWASDDHFAWMVQFIRTYGEREKYGKSWYTIWIDQGRKYWTMGAPIPATILINRKQVPERAAQTTPGLVAQEES